MASISRNDAYPPKWLTKDNVDTLGVSTMPALTIVSVGYEVVGEKRESKVVVRFREITQGLICGPTHFDALTALFGESDLWPGGEVRVVRSPRYGKGVGEPGLLVLPTRQAAPRDEADTDTDDIPF